MLSTSSIFGSALASKQIHSDIDFQMRRPKVEIESFRSSSKSFALPRVQPFAQGDFVHKNNALADDSIDRGNSLEI